MAVFGFGHETCTSTTRPASPSLGQLIYQTDTDEYLKYVNYGGADRWMQAVLRPGRNVVTNGGFDVWQRGTSLSHSGGGYGADMWRQYTDVGSGTQSKDTAVFTGNTKASYKWTQGASTGNWSIFQYIETSNCAHMAGKPVTLSLWARSNATPRSLVFTCSYSTSDDAGWPSGAFVTAASSTVTLSNQWVFYSVTVTLPGTARTLQVSIGGGATDVASGTTINVTGVQLEFGSAPSEFEVREYGDELRRCQRYFYRQPSTSSGYQWSNQGGSWDHHHTFPLPCEMRIVPVLSSSFSNVDNARNGGQSARKMAVVQYVRANNTSFGYYAFNLAFDASAEL